MDVNFIIQAEVPQLERTHNARAHQEWIELSIEAGESRTFDAKGSYFILVGSLTSGVSVKSTSGKAGGTGLQVHRHTGVVTIENKTREAIAIKAVLVSFPKA